MIVVDTNLIAYLLIEGEKTGMAERVLEADQAWKAPFIWRSELRSALTIYVRRDLITLDDASRVMVEAESMMAYNEFIVASADVLALSVSSGCSAYDAEFVVLAKDLEVPFVTADKELLEKFPGIAVSPQAFLTRP